MTAVAAPPSSDTRTRVLCAVFLCVAAAAHIPLIPEHLREATYMGVAFVGFVYACLATAAGLLLSPRRLFLWATIALGLVAVAAYVVTRLVPFPQLSGDVGEWLIPLGVIAVAAELAAAAYGWMGIAEERRSALVP